MEIDEIPVGRAEDLRGQKFGKLTVLYRTHKPPHVKNTNAYWKCKCECGNTKVIASAALKRGDTVSCGCGHKNNLTNKRYGRLIALKQVGADKHGNALWECKCDCGNVKIISADSLINGKTNSCGCLRKELLRQKSYTIFPGERYGKLTVIEEAYIENAKRYWKCQCDCGNITYVASGALTTGNTKSCGCIGFPNEIGNQYGRLTVIDSAPSKKNCSRWVCKCKCGNTIITTGKQLRSGNILSCGCLRSKGNNKISKILLENHINFKTEHTFKDCCGNYDMPLRFDFYCNNEYLIEYDGEQHFRSVEGWGGIEGFQQRHDYDIIKNNYCQKNNIPLIRIPYWHYNDITIEDLIPETSQFLI